MNKRPSLQYIADQIGCSKSTVSRVLGGKAKQYRISEDTANEILDLANSLHYTPNVLAGSLRSGKTFTVGLMIPDISNPFFANIARYVERETRKLGYSIILCDTEESTELEIESIHLLKSRNVDGMIVSPVGQTVEHIQDLYDSQMPIVIIDRYFSDSGIPFVASNNYQGAKDAVTHLVQNGHCRIACVQGLRHTQPNNDRVQGYKDALHEAGVAFDEKLVVGDSFGEENGYLETKLLMQLVDKPTAIFGVSNLISLGILKALKEENYHVPDDVSLIGFDDHPFMSYLSTPLTTVEQQSVEMGKIAVKFLYNQIQQSDVKSTFGGIQLPTRLIIRNSVKKL